MLILIPLTALKRVPLESLLVLKKERNHKGLSAENKVDDAMW